MNSSHIVATSGITPALASVLMYLSKCIQSHALLALDDTTAMSLAGLIVAGLAAAGIAAFKKPEPTP